MTIKPPDLSRLLSLRARNIETREDMQGQRERFHAVKERTAVKAVVAHQLFQTPEPLASRLVSLLGDIRGLSVLEPSAGLGRLADALKAAGAAEVVGVEVAAQCVEVLRVGRPWLEVIHADFLTVEPDRTGQFDAIAMNPPFTMRSDIRHILHAHKFLLPGGRLAGICMAGPARERDLRPLCDTWEELPQGAFKESNTNVGTIIFTISR